MRAFAARAYTAEHQRMRVRSEDKDAIAAFHWRGAPDEDGRRRGGARRSRGAPQEEGLAVHWGRKVLEVRPPVALDKGLGIATLLQSPPAPPVDRGAVRRRRHDRPGRLPRPARARRDGDARRTAICVAVSSDEAPPELAAEADLPIDGTGGVRGLLEALL